MNREIKFRGKRKKNGSWIYGSLCRQKDLLLGDETVCVFPPDGYDSYDNYVVNEETVGQYSGLKDKNGVEIYPGDILFSKGKIIGYVVDGVRAYCYDVMYINHPSGEKRWSLWATVTVDYDGNIEVKGNIYDNPELINKEK